MFSIPFITGFVGSGQISIPIGVRGFTVDVVSGGCFINSTYFVAPQKLTMVMPDSKDLMGGAPIVVGQSGVGNKVTVFWNN